MEENQIFNIPLVNIEKLNERVSSLNKATKKLNLPEIVVKVLGVSYLKTSKKETMPVYKIELVGTKPKFAGWTFLGAIEYTEAGNLIKNYSDVSLEHYRGDVPVCDHCEKKRNRKQTYVVKHEDGRIFRVGKSCLKDFLGHQDPNSIAKMLEYISDLRSDQFDQGREYDTQSKYTDLKDYLKMVSFLVSKKGYVSKKNCGTRIPTSEEASIGLSVLSSSKATAEQLEHFGGYREHNPEVSEKALAWINEQVSTDTFTVNMKTLAQLPFVPNNNLGIAAYIIPAYLKAIGEEIYKKKAIERPSEFLGAVGEKISLKVTCTKVVTWEGQFGVTLLHIFVDENGNRLEWKTGTRKLEEGKSFEITAAVKNHKEYKGQKITEVTRPKIVELEAV